MEVSSSWLSAVDTDILPEWAPAFTCYLTPLFSLYLLPAPSIFLIQDPHNIRSWFLDTHPRGPIVKPLPNKVHRNRLAVLS
jgi:hypothetical protein